jgi:2-aminoethylphosphonate transport system ATP-binding protein
MSSSNLAAVAFDAAAGLADTAAAAVPGSGIGFENVTVAYKGAIALDALNLDIAPGEIMAIIGPSGCGKTTALRAVAGFVRPTSGRIRIGDQDVTDLPPHARDIGMVVQSYALFPHMRVAANVAFGLNARGAAANLVRTRVEESLRMVGMTSFAERLPRELSGGQQQRVAIARALAIRPRVLLLDEPLSALDAQIRHAMLDELARLHRELPHLTVLYVTHDQSEALTLADRIAIMRGGKLMAQGPSSRLYHEPPNRFAAEFLGRANLLPVAVEANANGVARLRLGDTRLTARAPHTLPPGKAALLCIRPHAMVLTDDGRENHIPGVVREVIWRGDSQSVEVEVSGGLVRLSTLPMREPPVRGTPVMVHFHTDDATLIADD